MLGLVALPQKDLAGVKPSIDPNAEQGIAGLAGEPAEKAPYAAS
jgi:hypothetical protein